MSSRRVIGTRSKSRDEMDSKENVENDQQNDSRPPSPSMAAASTPAPSRSPNAKQQSTAKTNRSAASLFSPQPHYSETRGSPYAQHAAMKKPDPFPDNWEETMGPGGGMGGATPQAPSSASRPSRQSREPQDSFGYAGMSQVRWIGSSIVVDATCSR